MGKGKVAKKANQGSASSSRKVSVDADELKKRDKKQQEKEKVLPNKQKFVKGKEPASGTSSDSDLSSEEEQKQNAKKAAAAGAAKRARIPSSDSTKKGGVQKQAKKGDKQKQVVPVSSDDSDESEDEAPKKSVGKKPVAAATNGKAKKQKDSSDDEEMSSESDVDLIVKGKGIAPAKQQKKQESSDEDSSDDKKKPAAKVAAKKGAAKKDSSDDEDSEEVKKPRSRKQSNVSAKGAKKGKKDESEEEEEENGGDEDKKELFVGNLSFNATEDTLTKHFSKYGTVVNAKVPKRPNGQSKGIAFIEFESHKEAQNALNKENGKEFDGRALKINFSGEPPAEREGQSFTRGGDAPSGQSSTLFVGNLGFRTTADSLKAHFADCGSVRDVRIPYNDDGRPKGFAHVEFEDAAAAQEALKLNGEELDGRALRLDVSESKSRGGFGGGRGGFGDRGGFRGRGGDRGGFRGGDRGGFRGGDRGGFRGGDRGGFRGRGGDRGGFRGGSRGFSADSGARSANKGNIVAFQGKKQSL